MTAAARQETAGEKQSIREVDVEDLSAEQAGEELAALAAEIAHHDALYHQQDKPEISDADYDALRRRNDAIELRFPELKRGDSPSQKVGAAPAAGFSKVRHAVPMLSLGNAFAAEEIEEFVHRIRRFLNIKEGEPVSSLPNPRSTGSPARSATSTASWSWRHPWRRERWRGRHRQCPHHPRRARRPDRSVPMCSKCVARSIWSAPISWR